MHDPAIPPSHGIVALHRQITRSSVFSILTTHLLDKTVPDSTFAAEMFDPIVAPLLSSLLTCVAKHPLLSIPSTDASTPQENAVCFHSLPSS